MMWPFNCSSWIEKFFSLGDSAQGASIEYRRFLGVGWHKKFKATIHSAKDDSRRAVGWGDTAEEAVDNLKWGA